MRLKLSSEGRHALRALLYLAWLGEQTTADRISAEARSHGAYSPVSWRSSPAPAWSKANRAVAEDLDWHDL